MEATQDNRQRPIGGSVGLVFAGLWSVLGALAMRGIVQLFVFAAGPLLSALLVARLWRVHGRGGDTGMFRRRAYLLAVILEVAALYAVAFLLPRFGLSAYFIPAVGLVVGLHFIGLWRATGYARFLWIAGCMSAVSIMSMALPASAFAFVTNLRNAVCGLGNAIVLWIFAGRSIQLESVMHLVHRETSVGRDL
ncbi:MAG TPA: hypothetical protein VGL35_07225 [Rhizomicrobium sp.]|jgi:hypothetical protein